MTLDWKFVGFAVLLASFELQYCNGNNVRTERGKRTLYLLALLPYPDDRSGLVPSWASAPLYTPALELARDQINNRSDILDEYKLELVFSADNSGCNGATKAAMSFVKDVFSEKRKQIAGIIGPECSPSTTLLSSITSRSDVALISIPLAHTVSFDDDYSFGISGSYNTFVDFALGLMTYNKWTQVAVLYELTPLRTFNRDYENFKQRISGSTGGEVLFSSAVDETFIPLDAIKDPQARARVVFMFTTPDLAYKILCLASHKNLTWPFYQWILGTSVIPQPINFTHEGKTYSCSKEEMLNVSLKGVIYLHPTLVPLDADSLTESGISHTQYLQEYSERVDKYNSNEANPYRNISVSAWATVAYDAVWTMALALDKAVKYSNVNLTTYQFGQRNTTDAIRDQIYQLEFDGMSGHISFNPKTGRVVKTSNVSLIFNGVEKHVGYFANNTLLNTTNTQEYFIEDHFETKAGTVSFGLAMLFLTLVVLQFLLIIAVHVVSTIYRHYASIKASSLKLKHLLFLGCYLLIASTLLYIVLKAFQFETGVQGIICHLVWGWMFWIGSVMSLGALSVCSWRLYRIFAYAWRPGPGLSNIKLSIFVLFLVLVCVIISTVWTAIDPLTVDIIKTESLAPDGVRMVILEPICRCHRFCVVWYSMYLGYVAFMILVTVTLTFLTGSIRFENFSTNALRLHIYLLALTAYVGIPGYAVLLINGLQDWSFAVLCLLMSTIIFLFLFFVFLPPLVPLLRTKCRSWSHSFTFTKRKKIKSSCTCHTYTNTSFCHMWS